MVLTIWAGLLVCILCLVWVVTRYKEICREIERDAGWQSMMHERAMDE